MKGSRLLWSIAFVVLAVSVVAVTAEAQPFVYALGRDSSFSKAKPLERD